MIDPARGEAVLEAHWFALVDRLAASECRRRGLRPEDAEEFRAHARLRLAERGEHVLAAHDGRSGVETYLHVVVARWLCDWRRTEWGTWRSSAAAVRLGDVAIALEQGLGRDARPFDQVAIELGSRFGARARPQELERLRAQLPSRTPPREGPREEGANAEQAVLERERAEVARRLGDVLRRSLGALPAADRLILSLVFRDGLSVRAAARAIGAEHKRIGRRLDRILAALRGSVERGGVDRHGVLLFLEAPQEFDGRVWDNPPARPSTREVKS